MLGKGHGGLYNASTKEERRKRKVKRRERSDQTFHKLHVLGMSGDLRDSVRGLGYICYFCVLTKILS